MISGWQNHSGAFTAREQPNHAGCLYPSSELEQAGCTEQGCKCKDDGAGSGSGGRREIPANYPVADIGPLLELDLIVTLMPF
jgi:hypothetical protein